MPYLLLFIGCIFLGLGVLGLFVPRLQSLDLLSVQILSEYRSEYLNSITIFLARIGGMPFVLFYPFWCVYIRHGIKNILLLFSLAREFLAVSPWVGCSSGVLIAQDPRRYIILSKVTVHRSQVHTVFMHQHWLVWQ